MDINNYGAKQFISVTKKTASHLLREGAYFQGKFFFFKKSPALIIPKIKFLEN
jgi:hypothetical protein